VNLSMNQVLMRSLNTSIAALLPVVSLLVVGSWIMGAVALRDFALALFIGLLTGAYSSIFIATPILAALKEREPRYAKLRAKLGRLVAPPAEVRAILAGAAGTTTRPSRRSRGAAAAQPPVTPADVPVRGAEEELVPVAPASAPASTTRSTPTAVGLNHPPRPRKKKRK